MAEVSVPAQRRPGVALGVAVAILYVFLWASAFVPSRILARGAPPLTILWIRFLLAGGLLFAGVWAARLPVPRDGPTWVRLFALGLGGNAVYLGLSYEALRRMSAGMGSIVASTNPLILALVAPWLLQEPLTVRKATGLILGFAGVVLAMHTRAGSSAARTVDVLLSLAGVLAFVFSNVLYKRMRARPHPVVLNAAQLFCAGLALVPAALLLEGPPHIQWTAPIAASLAYLVVVLSVGASMLWFWILQHGEASRVSAYFFLTPVFGLLLGAVLLGEPLAPMDGVALVVIAIGLWLV
ncbi:MAG TPA: DMT family transporter [Myxococcales bacterium]|nr:DMT family transporter [Myxococcales bacterium]